MNRSLPALLVALGLSLAPGCKGHHDVAPANDAGPGATAPDPLGPPSRHELPTTDGVATIDNLNGQIQVLEGIVHGKTGQGSNLRQLIPLLGTRARFLGRVADAERAASLAEQLVQELPHETWPLLLRASTRSAMHLFPEALADLAEARRRGTSEDDVADAKAAILEAQGDLDGALALRTAMRKARPDLTSMGLEALLLGKIGRRDEAVKLFTESTRDNRSVSAFPVAWLFLQEGTFWESAGEKDRARAYYEAAHERLPSYAHAASHLATLVDPNRGIELLKPVVASSDDPEFEMILARCLQRAGRGSEAEAHLARVRARYAELVAKHPEAYAEHAGWFLLDERKDPDETLALAKKNLAVRRTDRAYELAVLAALAAGKRDEACGFGQEAQKLPHASDALRGLAASACKSP